jgi:hypothetical protein
VLFHSYALSPSVQLFLGLFCSSVPLQVNPKAADSLADPAEYPNLFEDWQVALTVEQNVAAQR